MKKLQKMLIASLGAILLFTTFICVDKTEVQAVMKEAINAVAVDRSEAAQKEDEALENQ